MDIARLSKEPIVGKVTYNHSDMEVAENIVGTRGALLSHGKIQPNDGTTIIFNACIFNIKGEEIWWGDINIDNKQKELQELANKIGLIHVTPEQPARWDGLKAALMNDKEAVEAGYARRARTYEREKK